MKNKTVIASKKKTSKTKTRYGKAISTDRYSGRSNSSSSSSSSSSRGGSGSGLRSWL